jgi:hypothetical protein
MDTSVDSGASGQAFGSGTPGVGDEINLSMPRKSAHDVYLIHAFNTLSKFNQIVFTLSGTTDPRVVPYARQCINLVLDDNIKKSLQSALKEALKYIETTELPPEEKGSLQIEICQQAVGEVNTYLDEFIGLNKTNAIVPIASTPTDEEFTATMDILKAGGDIEVGGEEITDPDKARQDPETISQPLNERGEKQ